MSAIGLPIAVRSKWKLPKVLTTLYTASVSAPSTRLGSWPLHGFIREAFATVPMMDPSTDSDKHVDIANYLLDRSSPLAGRVTSKASLADSLGVDQKTYSADVCRLANTIVHSDRMLRGLLAETLTKGLPKSHLLCYIDFAMYDETPMKLAAAQHVDSSLRHPVDPPSASPASVAIMQRLPAFLAQSCNRKSKTVIKLLQSSSRFGFLIKHPGSGRLVVLQGSSLTWLQHLDRTTSECLFGAEVLRSAHTANTSDFGFKVRMSVLDRGGSNDKSEREVLRQRGPEWTRFPWTCCTHNVANVYTDVFSLVDSCIRGHVHFALSLNFGTNLTRFSKHLKLVVRDRLRIRRGNPPTDCIPYKQHLLRFCLARGTNLLQKKLALWALPNGD